jgi:hypothetical protein
LAKFDLKSYARRGAEARIAELNEELAAIYITFPELRKGAGQRGRRAGSARTTPTPEAGPKRARKRRKMSAAQRKAVGERMRKYWAARRASSTKKR